jgi:hypothetical protein
MCCQIPDGFKVDRKVHGCAIGGVKGGSPSRSVRAHWLVVGAVAGWSPWLGGRNFFPRAPQDIDQFSNLEGIAGRILGCYEHGPTFFVREILDGIAAKPGGDYIHSVCRHRQVVPHQSDFVTFCRIFEKVKIHHQIPGLLCLR